MGILTTLLGFVVSVKLNIPVLTLVWVVVFLFIDVLLFNDGGGDEK